VLAALALGCDEDVEVLPRPEANVVFATSTVHTGNLGGLAGGDAICAERATEAGLDGTFVAWLSAGTSTPYPRIAGARGWALRDGTPVADLADAFVTQSMLGPIARDERGRDIRATQAQVFTGTTSDGGPDATCSDWTTEAGPPERAAFGDAADAGGNFTQAGSMNCFAPRRIYCFETDRSVPVQITPQAGRFAFISTSTAIPSAAGIAAADQQCQGDALAAGLPGTYKAILRADNEIAANRFDLTGPPWVRTDGALIASSALELFTSVYLLAPLDRLADGTPAGNRRLWAGDPLVASTITCAGFTMRTAGQLHEQGHSSSSRRRDLFSAGGAGCESTMHHLICLQE
jgi:hypothetical protein